MRPYSDNGKDGPESRPNANYALVHRKQNPEFLNTRSSGLEYGGEDGTNAGQALTLHTLVCIFFL